MVNISGFSRLTSLSFRRNNEITSQGMYVFAQLVNLIRLDLEKCPGIHGGLVHLQGTFHFLKYSFLEGNITRQRLCLNAGCIASSRIYFPRNWLYITVQMF